MSNMDYDPARLGRNWDNQMPECIKAQRDELRDRLGSMTDREIMQRALEALEETNKLSVGENAICLPAEIDGAMDALRDRLAQPERHELQAKGTHPAPCARHCEANAFQIVIKNLEAQLAQPEQNNSRQLKWAKAQADHWKQHCFHLMKQLQEKNT